MCAHYTRTKVAGSSALLGVASDRPKIHVHLHVATACCGRIYSTYTIDYWLTKSIKKEWYYWPLIKRTNKGYTDTASFHIMATFLTPYLCIALNSCSKSSPPRRLLSHSWMQVTVWRCEKHSLAREKTNC